MQLLWQPPGSQHEVVIPSGQLSPPKADTDQPQRSDDLYYLHAHHLGSVALVTSNVGTIVSLSTPLVTILAKTERGAMDNETFLARFTKWETELAKKEE